MRGSDGGAASGSAAAPTVYGRPKRPVVVAAAARSVSPPLAGGTRYQSAIPRPVAADTATVGKKAGSPRADTVTGERQPDGALAAGAASGPARSAQPVASPAQRRSSLTSRTGRYSPAVARFLGTDRA